MAGKIASDSASALLWWVAAMSAAIPVASTPGYAAENAFPHVELSSAAMGTAAKQVLVADRRDAAAHPLSTPLSFDLDVQPLDRALEAFGAATGLSVIYNSKLTEGRMSRPVRGVHTPRAALELLIEGTCLKVRYTAADALVLVQGPVGEASGIAPAGVQQRYRGLVQAKIGEAFCADERLAAGDRRIAFRFWIGASGSVERTELLDSTGDPRFDAAVVGSLQRISIGESLPVGMTQPFTMLVLPRSSGHAWACAEPPATVSGSPP